ncbi:MAG: lactonase family protein [Gemmataceae bacterium]|nr:lactonase family protein [Gemmataceae bacterium]
MTVCGFSFARWLLILIPLLAAMIWTDSAAAQPKPEKLWVYLGTYTHKGSKGIYRCELDLATGKLSAPVVAGQTANPSFLAIHPNRRFLYAVGEISNFEGKKTGAISAFAIDPKTGDLMLLNQQSSGGAGPCHLVVDKEGKNVLAANYGGGSACSLPIGADGKLGEATAVVQHKGSSVNPKRQEGPHAHSINLDAANRHAFVADLGLDKVMVYRFDPAKGKLTANEPPSASVAPGAGPRHFAFHPSGKYAYVINELANTVTAFTYDPERGVLKELQSVTTLPKDFKGTSHTAEVVAHPSGKFLYGSNRGHDSLAIFRIGEDGKLTPAGHQSEGIKTPRNFAIDPTGAYLLAAGQAANKVIVFRIDPQTGELKPTGNVIEVPVPVCVRFMPAK